MDIVEKVKEFVFPILEERDLKLVDVELTKGKRPVLRIYIYNPEGTSIGDCEFVSRRIGAILDVEDLIPYSYELEVSSPGLNRKLKNKEEYEIFKGKDIKIVTTEPLEEGNKNKVYKGKLLGLENENVKIEEDGKIREIPYEKISKANLEF
ncbi:ribosome maturation factor RimP [Hydrogenothermus marinus]|uniref:Ribosome maturation factor RimP n=1 Tax=Hydrogenothermus marinus TaxID=133270 RepID=A0A3M0BS45_9AQUI|nr:ribosome maturation factor RimP [Hydrogenothermus marinus]RMA97325.1 ribosome maturation factor RimP [Hydrogenothermus marinus]